MKNDDKTRIIRGTKRAIQDRQVMYHILDRALICHLGFVQDDYPVVIPTCHWREGDKLYWHAHSKAQNVTATAKRQVCVTVTLTDGLVLARSAFNHSVNYRSVMAFGEALTITDSQEKLRQFELMVNKFAPQRWSQLRPVTDTEIKATGLMQLDLQQVSCKVRAEMAVDEPEDIAWPVWAGVVPIHTHFGEPQVNNDIVGDYPTPQLPKRVF